MIAPVVTNPKASVANSNQVTATWAIVNEGPAMLDITVQLLDATTTGSIVSSYKVDDIKATSHTFKNLKPGSYRVRIVASNTFGVSTPVTTDLVTIAPVSRYQDISCYHYGIPGEGCVQESTARCEGRVVFEYS